MNLYFELMRQPVFRIDDVNRYYNNMNSARSAVKSLMREGLVTKIRNNLYTCISGETGAPIADRFQIAGSITPTSYASHHTAMEYHGVANQVYYEVYVSSETSFRDFTFEDYTYRYVRSNSTDGIEHPEYSGGIAVTNPERTLIDSIKDMERIAGIEEIVQCIGAMQYVNEHLLLQYMSAYGNQFLYQKTGFLLSSEREHLGLSDAFFEQCHAHIGSSKRYLTHEIPCNKYNGAWRLVVPEQFTALMNGGMEDADL